MSACPDCGFSPDQLSPADGAVALRSFPRRFGELVSPDDPRRDEKMAVVGRETSAAAAEILSAGEDLRRVLVLDHPELGPTDVGLTSDLQAATDQVATTAEGAHGDQWRRTGRRGGREVTALDLLAEAVHAGVHHLRLAQAALGSR